MDNTQNFLHKNSHAVTYAGHNVEFLNIQHFLFRHIWKVNSAPVTEILQKGASVLDVGCGTGIWVTEMSKNYPSSNFTGIDILQLFPKCVTKNSTFFQYNLLEPLPFEDNYFDYVHCRFALMEYNTKQWTEIIIPEMVRVTKHLGFVEHCEVDERHVNEGPIMREITDAIADFNNIRNVNGMIGEKLDTILLETGLLFNIHHQQKYSPLGNGWGGEYGKLAVEIFTQRCLIIKDQLSEVMNITPEEFDGKIEACIDETKSTRTYLKSHRVYAQKIAPISN
jgi:SAM-dependent methyltransferase